MAIFFKFEFTAAALMMKGRPLGQEHVHSFSQGTLGRDLGGTGRP